MVATAEAGRLAQVALHIADARQRRAFEINQIKTAQSQALSGAINSVMRYHVQQQAFALERERVGFARRQVELQEKQFKELEPMRAAALRRARTDAERAEIQTAFEKKVAPYREEEARLGVEGKEALLRRRQVETLAGKQNIAIAAKGELRAGERHQMDLLSKGFSVEDGEVKFDPRLAQQITLAKNPKARQQLLDLVETEFLYKVATLEDGQTIDVDPRIQNLYGKAFRKTQVNQEFINERSKKHGITTRHRALIKAYDAQLKHVPPMAMIMHPNSEESNTAGYMNKKIGSLPEMLGSEVDTARQYAAARNMLGRSIGGPHAPGPSVIEGLASSPTLGSKLDEIAGKVDGLKQRYIDLTDDLLASMERGKGIGGLTDEEQKAVFRDMNKAQQSIGAKMKAVATESRKHMIDVEQALAAAGERKYGPGYVLGGFHPTATADQELAWTAQQPPEVPSGIPSVPYAAVAPVTAGAAPAPSGVPPTGAPRGRYDPGMGQPTVRQEFTTGRFGATAAPSVALPPTDKPMPVAGDRQFENYIARVGNMSPETIVTAIPERERKIILPRLKAASKELERAYTSRNQTRIDGANRRLREVLSWVYAELPPWSEEDTARWKQGRIMEQPFGVLGAIKEWRR